MGTLIRTFAILLIASGGLRAQLADPWLFFWEPDLPGNQSFLTLWRSIKSFALSHYDIVQEGERHPATELTVELTHGTVYFFHAGSSQERSKSLSLKTSANGKFADDNRLERLIPGKESPGAPTIRGPDPLRHARFSMKTSEDVEALYRQLNQHFKINLP